MCLHEIPNTSAVRVIWVSVWEWSIISTQLYKQKQERGMGERLYFIIENSRIFKY